MNKKLKEKLIALLPEGFSAEAVIEIVQLLESQIDSEVKVFKDKLSRQVSVYLKEQYDTLCESAKANAKTEAEKTLQLIVNAIKPQIGESIHLDEAVAEKTNVLLTEKEEMVGVIQEAREVIENLSKDNKALERKNKELLKQVQENAKALRKNFSGKAVIVAQNLNDNASDDDADFGTNPFLTEEVMSFNKNLD
jgi:HD superfamily phosphohydrolase